MNSINNVANANFAIGGPLSSSNTYALGQSVKEGTASSFRGIGASTINPN